jgi:hypothetical protein
VQVQSEESELGRYQVLAVVSVEELVLALSVGRVLGGDSASESDQVWVRVLAAVED